MNRHYLYPGQLAVFDKETVISTLLGSCVAVALFDPEIKVGGLNHYLLPEPTPYEPLTPRYGTIAIAELILSLQQMGAKTERLQAKIYGGASVISNALNGPSIGELNIALAEKILRHLRIPIIERNVGGTRARVIKLNTKTFHVLHNITDDKAA